MTELNPHPYPNRSRPTAARKLSRTML